MADSINAAIASRHGFLIDGVGVLIPRATSSEYLTGVTVYPVPRAPDRLRGLAQLRGRAVPAIDIGRLADQELPVRRQVNLLVLGSGIDAVGLICELPPVPVVPVAGSVSGEPKSSDKLVWCEAALTNPRKGQASGDDESVAVWWEMNLDELVQLCLHQARLQSDRSAGA